MINRKDTQGHRTIVIYKDNEVLCEINVVEIRGKQVRIGLELKSDIQAARPEWLEEHTIQLVRDLKPRIKKR